MMKIIIEKNRPIIECNYDEGIKIIKSLMNTDIKTGSGNYPHKSEVSEAKKELIRKIFENNPERSIRTVAKELDLTDDQVKYWKDKQLISVNQI